MSYDKQTWTSGEIITAPKLNHIENGIEEAENSSASLQQFVVRIRKNNDDYVTDKTFAETKSVIDSGNYNIIAIIENADSNGGDVLQLMAFAFDEDPDDLWIGFTSCFGEGYCRIDWSFCESETPQELIECTRG